MSACYNTLCLCWFACSLCLCHHICRLLGIQKIKTNGWMSRVGNCLQWHTWHRNNANNRTLLVKVLSNFETGTRSISTQARWGPKKTSRVCSKDVGRHMSILHSYKLKIVSANVRPGKVLAQSLSDRRSRSCLDLSHYPIISQPFVSTLYATNACGNGYSVVSCLLFHANFIWENLKSCVQTKPPTSPLNWSLSKTICMILL